MNNNIIKSNNISEDLRNILESIVFDKLFVLTDDIVYKYCFPKIEILNDKLFPFDICIIPNGDENKNLNTLTLIWQFLIEHKATRHSLLINIGGGMITDIGGFAAATFKRGMKCINIPTTLLGAVDAAVGGKTGINFDGLKNEIGVFSVPKYIIIHSLFFNTLDAKQLRSGFAEMLKHALLCNKNNHFDKILNFDLCCPDYSLLNELVLESVKIKDEIVQKDPTEQNIRKALNLGHTIGHAFESLSYKIGSPIPHGYAVAWGLICELYISSIVSKFSIEKLKQISHFVKKYYTGFVFDCSNYEDLYELMKHDKKNKSSFISFTLLGNIGEIEIDKTAEKEMIFSSFDYLRDCLGL